MDLETLNQPTVTEKIKLRLTFDVMDIGAGMSVRVRAGGLCIKDQSTVIDHWNEWTYINESTIK